MDNKTKEQRSENMRKIKNKDSVIELTLRKALWNEGIRYRKNWQKLPGKPDIVITKYKTAIFCDSEFFHGKDWLKLKKQLSNSNNSEFWIDKIQRNIQRDQEVNKELHDLGWKVLRFWGNDIKKDTNRCVLEIKNALSDLNVTDTGNKRQR
ncbi:MAG: very short patch repair endonuclease [Methanomicrobium sp.]|nr:very short patch repair endonuclease [Methanomicrobium sp.]